MTNNLKSGPDLGLTAGKSRTMRGLPQYYARAIDYYRWYNIAYDALFYAARLHSTPYHYPITPTRLVRGMVTR